MAGDPWRLNRAWLEERMHRPASWTVLDRDDITRFILKLRQELEATPEDRQPLWRDREQYLQRLENAMEEHVAAVSGRLPNDFTIEFVGGPLDGRTAFGDDPPEEFDAPGPLSLDEPGRALRYRTTGRPEPLRVIAEFLGYSDELDPDEP